jgi:hypothetical protein
MAAALPFALAIDDQSALTNRSPGHVKRIGQVGLLAATQTKNPPNLLAVDYLFDVRCGLIFSEIQKRRALARRTLRYLIFASL